jgi:hypothetical protein
VLGVRPDVPGIAPAPLLAPPEPPQPARRPTAATLADIKNKFFISY